jgi:ubiquinone/menaquinone biosynthesis C-methylase UbiE
MSTVDENREAWERASAHWDKKADQIRLQTAEATAGLIARLRPQPGQRLLDVAAGTGDPSLRLAELVGPAGAVVAADGARGMVDALARRVRERGLANVTVVHADAESLDLPSAFCDGACCRFGAMFFTDPPRALANIRRAVRRGGRLVLAVWGAPERNPYFSLANAVLEEVGVPEPDSPIGRSVFEYAEAGKLAALLAAAGWRDVSEDRAPLRMPMKGVAPAEFLDKLAEISPRVADRLAPVDEATRQRAREALARRAQPYARGADLELPAEVVYVTAIA